MTMLDEATDAPAVVARLDGRVMAPAPKRANVGLRVVPCSLRDAQRYVASLHRHHADQPLPGHKLSLAVEKRTRLLDGPQVMVRADLQRKLTECHQKIEGHRKATHEYDGWVQVLRANPEQRLKLTQADWLYFFGKA